MFKQYFVIFTIATISLASPNGRRIEDSRSHNENNNQIIQTDNKVNVKLFYESLCPYCLRFVTNQLENLVNKLEPYVDITMLPFGNAEKIPSPDGKTTIKCQHGPEECLGNTIHACAINELGNTSAAVHFVSCTMKDVENSEPVDYVAAMHKCSDKSNLKPYNLWQCAHSQQGSDLINYYAEATKKVNLDGVPYVMINDDASNQDATIENLMKVVCGKLHPAPKICKTI